MDTKQLYMRIGRAVKSHRNDLGVTQAELAQGIGVSRPALANIESGGQSLSIHQLLLLAARLKLESLDQLIPLGSVLLELSSSIPPALVSSQDEELSPAAKERVMSIVMNSLSNA